MGDSAREVGLFYELDVAKLLEYLGWRVRKTAEPGDFGVDLLLYGSDGPRPEFAVQCKFLTTGQVGVDAVQQAFAGARHYRALAAVVASNQAPTPRAAVLAESLQVRYVRVLCGTPRISFPSPLAQDQGRSPSTVDRLWGSPPLSAQRDGSPGLFVLLARTAGWLVGKMRGPRT